MKETNKPLNDDVVDRCGGWCEVSIWLLDICFFFNIVFFVWLDLS